MSALPRSPRATWHLPALFVALPVVLAACGTAPPGDAPARDASPTRDGSIVPIDGSTEIAPDPDELPGRDASTPTHDAAIPPAHDAITPPPPPPDDPDDCGLGSRCPAACEPTPVAPPGTTRCPDDPCLASRGSEGSGDGRLVIDSATFDGACGRIMVRNAGTGGVRAWSMEFTLASGARVTSFPNGTVTHTGTRVTVTPAPWSLRLAPGATAPMDYCAGSIASDVRLTDLSPAPPGTCDARVAHVDPGALTPGGEIRIGQAWLRPVWGETFFPRLPRVSWAIAIAHASRLMQLAGYPVSPNQFLATAMKESRLGCDPSASACQTYFESTLRDGCFQIECNTAYTELRGIYGARFNAPACEVLSGDHFETSALVKAFYDRFTLAYYEHAGYDPRAFFRDARDPLALPKTLAYAYNRGVFTTGLRSMFTSLRGTCAALPSLTNDGDAESSTATPCLPESWGHEYAWSVGRYTRALDAARNVYDANVTWADVSAYMDRIAPLYPEVTACSAVRASVRSAFDRAAGADGVLSFRREFAPVLDALIVALPAPEDPAPGIRASYAATTP